MIEYIICTILGFIVGVTVTLLVLSSTEDLYRATSPMISANHRKAPMCAHAHQ